jgi:NADPH2:quinone reductase
MKAIVYQRYGSPDVLEHAEIAKPSPKFNEVLIKVEASTVTSADCLMRRGNTFLSHILIGYKAPRKKYRILGTEFSGVIESIGSKVTAFKPGDEVYAFRGFGTGCYAEYKCMKENASIALKPENMSFSEAASSVDGATTALFFLKEKANVKNGQKVLINGASGSIGTFAVQLAKYFGAEVTAVCSTRNIEMVKSLGADKVIDYTKTDFTQTGDSYDLIFDTVSKSSFAECKKALKYGGSYIVTDMTLKRVVLSLLTKFNKRRKLIFSMSINKKEGLKFIKSLIEDGHIKTYIDKHYSLKEISRAHEYVEEGHKRGNVVIEI